MKIHFKTLDYQLDSVEAVVKCFEGQPKADSTRYTIDQGTPNTPVPVVVADPQQSLFDTEPATSQPTHTDNYQPDDSIGFANAPIASLPNVLANIQKVQAQAGLAPSDKLITADMVKGNKKNPKHINLTGSPLNLNIEMETGTGKTYCYIRTMFELNKHYGWSKFIVVVPSVAIREGVHKSFNMMAEHFLQDYGKKARFFTYNSKQLHHLESFSSDAGINVMIINMQAFNAKGKDARRIYDELDEFQSRRPIDVIKRNNPILILDEPQKMGAEKTLESMANFNPLFILRYSATHKRDYNLVHRLDALDAYNHKLVKKITVKGIETKGLSGTHGYLYLQDIEVSNSSAPIAKLELEVKSTTGFKRISRKVKKGDDLFVLSKQAEQYHEGYTVSEIDARSNTLEFTNGLKIRVGQAVGNVNETTLRTIQIRETIKAHIEKEKVLYKQGIKVLSLFFIDEVAKYRQYDDEGKQVDGDYAKIFIEEYNKILDEEIGLNITDDDYLNYLKGIQASDTHKGYFSVDKKTKQIINSVVKREDKEANISQDVDAYDLILKDKESLLAFAEPLDSEDTIKRKNVRFIFSHSALREGWDNPNVFVICTLKHSDNVISRRQEVGRGLRLAVNKHGERMDANYLSRGQIHQLNNLTVVSNESYTDFVSNLQKEMLTALANRPTKANQDYFVNKVLTSQLGGQTVVNPKMAEDIEYYLISNGYVDRDKKITDKYHQDKDNGTLAPLLEDLAPFTASIHKLTASVLNPAMLNDMVGNENKTINNPINPSNLSKKEFQELWSKINQKAIYQIKLDTDKLITSSIHAIEAEAKQRNNNFVDKLSYTVTTGGQQDNLTKEAIASQDSFGNKTTNTEKANLSVHSNVPYDLVGSIADGTDLTRKTVVTILKGINRAIFAQFKHNPEAFIRNISNIINRQKAEMLVQSLVYQPTDDKFPDNEIFVSNTKIPSDSYKAQRHVWDYVATDSKTETTFAQELDANTDLVVVYAKLPSNFKIPTPFGSYNPDWAIAMNKDKVKHIYFVAETKGSMDDENLKEKEKQKINSAKKFFAMLAENNQMAEDITVKYDVVDSFDNLKRLVGVG